MDDVKETVWVHTGQAIYEVVITEEDYEVWTFYLQKNQFDMAMDYCKVEHKTVIFS